MILSFKSTLVSWFSMKVILPVVTTKNIAIVVSWFASVKGFDQDIIHKQLTGLCVVCLSHSIVKGYYGPFEFIFSVLLYIFFEFWAGSVILFPIRLCFTSSSCTLFLSETPEIFSTNVTPTSCITVNTINKTKMILNMIRLKRFSKVNPRVLIAHKALKFYELYLSLNPYRVIISIKKGPVKRAL